jgi:hypothetical protein
MWVWQLTPTAAGVDVSVGWYVHPCNVERFAQIHGRSGDSAYTTFGIADNGTPSALPVGTRWPYRASAVEMIGGTMPISGERAREAGDYVSGCEHLVVSMRTGWEFPPCPQCHGRVHFARRSTASVLHHEWGDLVSRTSPTSRGWWA